MTVLEQIVSKPQKQILKSTSGINLFLAGVGSGKTFLLGIKTYQLIKKFPQVRGFIAANTYLQLEHSTLFRIREYWKSIGIVEYLKDSCQYGQYVINKKPPAHFNTKNHSFDDYYGIVSFVNGCVIFIGSMDNARAHEGKEFGWAVLDETKDTKEEDVKEIIIARIRQKGMYLVNGELSNEGLPEQQYNPLFITTSPAKVDWINSWFTLDKYIDEISAKIYSGETYFYKEFENKFVVISSTLHNVHNVGQNYIDNVLQNNTEERGKALIYANPFTQTGGEFYSSFDRLKHVGNFRYDPLLPIHISFDQNTVPYNSAGIAQIRRNNELWEFIFIDEIALENPRNSTEEVCEEFAMRYPNHKAGLYYYGDASGHNRSTMNKDFQHHYDIIAYKLNKYLNNGSDRTLIRNPSLVKRRDFVNLLFENKLPIRIHFDESCKKMIGDLMYTKQALDGGKDKHIVTDKDTGEKYQKYGHFGDLCFAADTLITTNTGKQYIKYLEVGDLVLTRNGYKKVLAVKHNGIKAVKTYEINDIRITCTPDHKIFADGNFSMVSSLIDKNIIAIFEEKQSWIDKLLIMAGINSIDTQMQKKHQTEIITKDGLRNQANGEKQVSISLSILKFMAWFQKVMLFITLTVTSIIMKLQIMNLCFTESIYSIITKYLHRNTKTRIRKNFLLLLFLHQKNGTDQTRGENGIKNTHKELYMAKLRLEYVLNVKMNLKQIFAGCQNTVLSGVKTMQLLKDSETKKDILKTEYANDAERHFQLINGVRINSVPVNVQKVSESNRFVYDITVEQEHEYFANGILVHNCEYMLIELFKEYYNG